jgi:hypothetical protein
MTELIPDPELEQRVRAELRETAEGTEPGDDGLARIQERIAGLRGAIEDLAAGNG